MYRGSKPKILPIVIVIIVIALIIATLVTVGRMIFSGDSSTDEAKEDTTSMQSSLLDQGSTRSVGWTVRGPIVANENFRSYQITVSASSRTYVVYSGYLSTVISSKTYDNNADAYEQFVFALDKTGVAVARDAKNTDLRGVCATKGLAYKFETLNNNEADHGVWSSTCKDSPGTMTADPLKVQALFVNQITDFEPLFNEVY